MWLRVANPATPARDAPRGAVKAATDHAVNDRAAVAAAGVAVVEPVGVVDGVAVKAGGREADRCSCPSG